MKKFLLILLAVLVTFGISYAENDDFLGEWFVNYISENGDVKINAQDVGFSAIIRISADIIIIEKEYAETTIEGTWKPESETSIIASFPDEEYKISLQDGCLSAVIDEIYMYFYRELPDKFVVPPVKTDAVAEDFEGKWKVIKVDYDDAIFDWELMSEGIEEIGLKTDTVIIKDGILDFCGIDELYRLHNEGDGVMAYRQNSQVFSFVAKDIEIVLHEDNIATLDYDDDLSFIFQKQ